MKKKLQALKAFAMNNRFGLATGVALVPMAARADGPDVSAVVTAIVAVGAAIATIGVAILSMKVGVKAYGWISQALK